MREKLKLKVLMNTGLSDKLERAAGGFMSEYEAKTVRQLPNNFAQVDKVIETLRGKGDEDFKNFCKMLRDSNQVVWADELERVAKQFKRGKGNSSCRRWTYCTMLCSHHLLHSMHALMFNFRRVQCLHHLGNTLMLGRLTVTLTECDITVINSIIEVKFANIASFVNIVYLRLLGYCTCQLS